MANDGDLPNKLRAARQAAGLSTRRVAEELSKRFSISHATIANYERGVSRPPIELLSALATLYERQLDWMLKRSAVLANIRYRNLPSKVRVRDRHRFEGEVLRWMSAYVALETRLGRPLAGEREHATDYSAKDPADLARSVRETLGYDPCSPDPLPSIIEVLHAFGVRVLEQPTELRIDGLAAVFGDEHVIVLNPSMPNDRGRMNAAHELGHILLGDCQTEASAAKRKLEEKQAFAFASHLLLPNAALNEAFKGQSMVRLVKWKERFGISLAAMVYRAEQQKVITKSIAKKLWIEFGRRGWRSQEPGHVRPDRATRFEEIVDSALADRRITLRQAAATAGVRGEELHERINLAMGIASIEEDAPTVLPFSKP
jgi:Zn-dependent peptidase ImmA (M78 family)/transcriptional regulator with XRE-family HTH domain